MLDLCWWPCHTDYSVALTLPSTATDSESDAGSRSPSKSPSRNRGSPRVGRHACTPVRVKPKRGEKKKANDVQAFFTVKDGDSSCLFCEYVSWFDSSRCYRSCAYAIDNHRENHTLQSSYPCTIYSSKTSTTVLRKHLCDCHADTWITGCDKLGIDITAKAAQNVVQNYRRRSGEPVLSGPKPEDIQEMYTEEAFLNALVDFIVSDDVVSLMLIHISSLLT